MVTGRYANFDSGASTDRQTPCSTREMRRLAPKNRACNDLRPERRLTNQDIRGKIQKNGRCDFGCSESQRPDGVWNRETHGLGTEGGASRLSVLPNPPHGPTHPHAQCFCWTCRIASSIKRSLSSFVRFRWMIFEAIITERSTASWRICSS